MRAVIDSSKAITWCATRRCRGSVAEVAAYLSGRFGDDVSVVTGSGSLDLVSGSRGVVSVGPVRTHRAKLTFGAWRRAARVTLEVEPWSGSESELLLRPTRRPPLGEEAYFAAALAVLESLADEVDAALTPVAIPTEEWLRAS